MSRRSKKQAYDEKTLAEKKLDFRRHLRTYLVMCVFFISINALSFDGGIWAVWPILGWGIGIVLQALSLYGPLADPEDSHPTKSTRGTSLPDLEERMELRELDTQRPYRDEDLV